MTNPATGAEAAPDPAEKPKLPASVRRLFAFIVPVNLSIYIILGAVPAVLLPLQVQDLDPANHVGNLALITGVGAAVAIVVAPFIGQLSDRTRSRIGRRSPWLLGGALLTGVALIAMGFSNSIATLLIGWVAVQIAINFIISPLTAILPDRIPSAVRGLYSTLTGVGLIVGALGGQIVGSALSSNIRLAYFVLPGILIIVIAAFITVCRDAPSTDLAREPFSLGTFLKSFWVSPRRYPDFAWGFAGRITTFAGYFMVSNFSLFILQDYIGLGDDAVTAVPVIALINLLAVLVALAIAGPLSDRIRRRKPIVIGAAIIMGLAMIVPWAVPTLVGMWIFTAIVGFGFGAYLAVDAALMSEILPSTGTYAKDLGVLNIAATLPQTIAPFLGGAIVLAFGYAAMFPIALVLALIGSVCFLPIKGVR